MNDDLEKRTCCTVINLNEIFISYGMSVGELMLRFIEKNLIVIFIFGLITVNPPEVRPVFALPTRGLKLITLPT